MSRSCSNSAGSWLDHLPFVLLGMRTSIRADSRCSAADLLYSAPLRLPGDMFEPSTPVPLASDFSTRLRTVLGAASPMPVVSHGSPRSRVDPALSSCSHVFLRVDAVRRPLVPLYLGPFPVLSRTDKTFDLLQHGKTTSVSIDRLKPAFLTCSLLPPSPVEHDDVSASASVAPSSPSDVRTLPPTPASQTVLRTGRISKPVKCFQA